MILNISIICFIRFYLFLSTNTWFSIFDLCQWLFKFASYIFIIHQIFLIRRRSLAFFSWFIFNIYITLILKHFLIIGWIVGDDGFLYYRVKRYSFLLSIELSTWSRWVGIYCGKFNLTFLIVHNFLLFIFILSEWNLFHICF